MKERITIEIDVSEDRRHCDERCAWIFWAGYRRDPLCGLLKDDKGVFPALEWSDESRIASRHPACLAAAPAPEPKPAPERKCYYPPGDCIRASCGQCRWLIPAEEQ